MVREVGGRAVLGSAKSRQIAASVAADLLAALPWGRLIDDLARGQRSKQKGLFYFPGAQDNVADLSSPTEYPMSECSHRTDRDSTARQRC